MNTQTPTKNKAQRPASSSPKLGDSEPVVKWTSKLGRVDADPSLVQYTLHAMGLVVTVFNNPKDVSYVDINDFYTGGTPGGYEGLEAENGSFSNPVFLPALNLIVMMCSDGDFRTVRRNSDGTVTLQRVYTDSSCVSNMISVDGDTAVYIDNSNQMNGLTFATDGGSFTPAFTNRPATASITSAFLQAIDNNHFAFLVPNNTGSSPYYYLTRTVTLKSSIAMFATGPFCIAGPYIYCLADDGSLLFIQQFRLDSPDGFQGWKTYFDDDVTQPSNLVIANNAIYFGYGAEVRYMRLDTGAMSTINVGDGKYLLNANPIFEADGTLYICVPNGQVYGVDLASDGAETANYNFSSLPALSHSVGVENGLFVVLTYIGNFFCVAGVDLSTLLHGYTTDSILMAEDMVAGGSAGYMPATPSYRTVVHLSDQDGVARSNTSVRIEATDAVTITCGGITATLSNPGDLVWFTTDGNGDLHMVCQADDIQSPALYLWAAFMDPSESMVVYPDHVSINKLKNYQGSDYTSAQSFDQTSVFSPNQSLDDVANTVSGVLGGGSTIDPPAGPYSSYGSSANLVYQTTKGATGRVMSAGGQTSFTTTIDVNGVVKHTSGGSVSSSGLTAASVKLTWDDFKNDVVKAGKKIKTMVVQIGDDIQHEITAIDDTVYQFTVDTFEKAVGVITGFFKTILADITKAIEWLSALFDWDAIKQLQGQIIAAVKNFQTNVRNYLNQDASKVQTMLGGFFTDAATNVQTYFDKIASDMGGGTLESQQPNGSDPQQFYTNPTGQSSGSQPGAYSHSQAMHSKLQDNVRKSSKSKTLPSTSPMQPDQLLSTFTDVITNQIPAALNKAGIFDQIKTAASNIPGDFSPILSDPGIAMKHTFADLIALIGDVAALFLEAVNVSLDIVVGLIADMLDTIVDILTGGFEIPILGPLFKLIFGKDLTFLDLVSFLIAVPASIMMKISQSVSGQQLAATESGWQLFGFFGSSVWGGIVDALSDAIAETGDDPICWLDICFGLITWALSAPYSGFDGNDPSICYFAFSVTPIIISAVNGINYALTDDPPTPEQLAAAKEFADNCYVMQGYYGIINITVAILNAFKNPDQFAGPGHAILAGNCFSNGALISKVWYPNAPKATIATDVAFPFASAVCSIFANVPD